MMTASAAAYRAICGKCSYLCVVIFRTLEKTVTCLLKHIVIPLSLGPD